MQLKIICLLMLLPTQFVKAQDLALPYLFSNRMVLQRNSPVRIWGQAAGGEKITVLFRQQSKTVTANAKGQWQVLLSPEPAGGPHTLTVKGKNETKRFEDVLVGEVWVCAGQSNMEWDVASSLNAQSEIAAANFPAIRQFDVPNKVAFSPQQNTDSSTWEPCTPATSARFSAVAYFFARRLYQELRVPVGLINSTWGGTAAEAWTSAPALKTHPDFAKINAPKTEAEYQALKAAGQKNMFQRFQGGPAAKEQLVNWSRADFDASQWPALAADKLWEEQSLPDFDGVVWYRTVINIAAEEAGQEATLHLGTIDDNDETFVNGKRIGSTRQWNATRSYAVPEGVLQAGSNVVLVRVVDDGGGGGFYGKEEKYLALGDGKRVNLPRQWQAQATNSIVGSRPNPNDLPASLFNGMVAPLTGYTIRGAIWYQGESNADRPKQYETLFPLLITDWRKHWQQPNFPFYFVQLSSYDPARKPLDALSNWALLRDAQRKTLSLSNTGMAVTTDVGERDDIHPKNKQDVGLRLALIALARTYHKPLVFSGPAFQKLTRAGNKITLQFNDAAGLVTRNNGPLHGFDGVDENGKVMSLNGTILQNKVVLELPAGTVLKTLQYAWHDDAGDANLQNSSGLPAVPFQIKL